MIETLLVKKIKLEALRYNNFKIDFSYNKEKKLLSLETTLKVKIY